MEQFKYYFSNILALPLFPILLYQAKQIRKNVPALPEASQPQGIAGNGVKTIRLLSIGESTIAGVGVHNHKQGLTGHLASQIAQLKGISVQWSVYAKSGYTVKKVNDRLIPKIDAPVPDIIVIGLGGNDTFKLTSPKIWQAEINRLIRLLQQKFPEVPIVFLNVPPIRSFPAFTSLAKFILGQQVDLLHQILVKTAKVNPNVWYIKDRIQLKYWLAHFKAENYSPEDFFSDGVHPSELTYKTWAQEAAKFIVDQTILS